MTAFQKLLIIQSNLPLTWNVKPLRWSLLGGGCSRELIPYWVKSCSHKHMVTVLTQVLPILFMWKVTFKKTSVTSHSETLTLVYVLPKNAIMLQYLIIQFTLYYLSSGQLWQVKIKENFTKIHSKSGRLWEMIDFGKLVVDERWSYLEVWLYYNCIIVCQLKMRIFSRI